VALAIKKARPFARVLAVEHSPAALAVADDNARRLELAVEFFAGDLLSPLPCAVDVLVANLPYIPSEEIARLMPEVLAEPRLALDGGPDGLLLIRRLIAQAPAYLVPGGALALEVGAGQAAAVRALLQAAGFSDIRAHHDLLQIPRVVAAHWPGPA
jgi:release factor glutamine methyltransferase